MKLIMAIYDTGAESVVEEALDKVGAVGWTRIPNVVGKGRTGLRLDNPIFSGTNHITFAMVEDDQVEPLKAELADIPNEFLKQLAFRVAILDAEWLV